MNDKPISSNSSPPARAGCLIPFFLVFFAAGCAGTWFMLVTPVAGVIAARGWEAVPCTIVSSEVVSHGNSDPTYSIEIRYAYRFGSGQFESDRYDFMGMTSSGRDGKAAVVAQYPVGEQRTCWVNPRDPGQAVLERGFHLAMLAGLFPLVFVAVGIGGVYFVLAKRSSSTSARPFKLPRKVKPSRGDAQDWRAGDSSGPAVLESQSSPLGRVFGVALFALFWNGIISIFIYHAAKSWGSGDPDWFLTVFMIPFAAIGIGALWGIVYYCMALLNPRPRMKIESRRIAMGGSARLEWTISGAAGKIKKLTISLEGEESATYRRGTDTRTDRHVFHRAALFESIHPREIEIGSCDVAVPAQTMHSWKGRNNKIEWRLKINGEIARWPDIDESYEIDVRANAGKGSAHG